MTPRAIGATSNAPDTVGRAFSPRRRRWHLVAGASVAVGLLLPMTAAQAADIEYYKGYTSASISFASYPNSVSYTSAFMNIDYTNRVARGYSWLDLTSTAGFSGNTYTYFEKQSGTGTTMFYGAGANASPGSRAVDATEVVPCGGGALFTSFAQFFVRSASGEISRGTQPSTGQQTRCTR